jgi:hypothetical protein
MFRQYQYDELTQPTVVPANPVTPSIDGWGQPQIQPTSNFLSKARGFAVALIATGIFFTTIVTPHADALSGVSSSVNRIRFQKKFASRIPSFFWSDYTPPAALTPVPFVCAEYPTKFYAKKYLTEAVDTSDGQASIGIPPPAVKQIGGSAGKSLRIKFTKPSVALTPSFFWSGYTPVITLPTGWLTLTNQPATLKVTSRAVYEYNSNVPPPQQLDWIQPQSQPVSRKVLTTAEQQAVIFGRPIAQEYLVGDISISQPYSTRKVLHASQQLYYFAPLSEQSENVLVSSWFQNTQQPYPFKKSLPSAEQQATFWNTSTSPENVLVPSWSPNYPQSYPTRPSLRTEDQQYFFFGKQVAQEYLVGNVPVAQPVVRLRNSAVYEPASGWIFTPPPVQTFNAWLPIYPDNVYGRDYLLAAQQQATFWNTSTQPENVLESSWQGVQGQQTRNRRIQSTEAVSFISDQGLASVILPERSVVVKALATYQPCSTWLAQPTSTVLLDWQQPQSQPVIAKRATQLESVTVVQQQFRLDWSPFYPDSISIKKLLVAEQQFLALNTSTSPETVFESSWQGVSWSSRPTKQYPLSAQQQAFFWNTLTPPDTLFPSHWGPQYPQPFPKKLYLQTASIPSTFWNTSTQSEVVTEDRWHQPQSQPYPFKPYRPAAVYPTSFYDPSFATEVVEVSSWAQQQSQPTPKRFPRASYETITWAPFTPAAVSLNWFQQIQQPIRKAVSVRSDITFVQPVEEGWNQQQAIVVRKQTAQQQQASFWNTFTPAEVITADKWQPVWPQPFPAKRVLTTAEQQTVFWNTSTSPETVFVSSWISQQNQSVRKLASAQQQSFFWSNYTPVSVSLDWFQQIQQPVKTVVKINTSAITFVQPTEEGWNQQQAIVVRKQVAQYQSFFWNDFTPVAISGFATPAPVYPDRVLSRQYLPANQQAFFWGEFTPAVVAITQPVTLYPDRLVGRRYLIADHQSCFWSGFTPYAPAAMDWQQAGNQPRQEKKLLATAEQQALAWNTSTSAETIFVSSWVQPQNQPKLTEKYRRACYDWVNWIPFTPAEEGSMEWAQPINQPYPYKHTLATAQQQAFFWHISTEEETVTVSSWMPPIEQPYPYGKHFGVALQQTSVWHISTQQELVLVSSWVQPISQPYPYTRVLLNAHQLSTVWNNLTPPPVIPAFVQGTGIVTEAVVVSGAVTQNVNATGEVSSVQGTGSVIQ